MRKDFHQNAVLKSRPGTFSVCMLFCGHFSVGEQIMGWGNVGVKKVAVCHEVDELGQCGGKESCRVSRGR